MKRTDLTNELLCTNRECYFLGKPEEFIPSDDPDVPSYCPHCGENTHVVAKVVEWCDKCGSWPIQKSPGECDECQRKYEEDLKEMAAAHERPEEF